MSVVKEAVATRKLDTNLATRNRGPSYGHLVCERKCNGYWNTTSYMRCVATVGAVCDDACHISIRSASHHEVGARRLGVV